MLHLKRLMSIALIGLLPFIAREGNTQEATPIPDAELCHFHAAKVERQHAIPMHMLRALTTHESGKWDKKLKEKVAWPWTIHARGRGYHFETKEEAIQKVKSLNKRGIKSIDVGCMQVNLYFHAKAFKSLEDAFDPKKNLEYAVLYLGKHYERYGSWTRAVARYHSGKSTKGKRYLNKVMTVWKEDIKNNPFKFDTITFASYYVGKPVRKPSAYGMFHTIAHKPPVLHPRWKQLFLAMK